LIKPSQLIKRLKKKGVILEKDNLFHEIFRVIESKRNLTHLEEYKRGLFYIQDKSSLLTGHAINAKTWDYVWDMCSAPGGKSSHLYQIFKGKINIIATDWKIQRIKTMKNILERLRINNIPLIVTNSVFPPFNRKFDKIIIDPDCSSLGRLGQSPEIRLWLTKDMILNFQKNQRKLIEISTDYLKKNGTLIYSTCTLTLEENEENVIWALNNFPFILEPIDIELGLNGLKGLNYTRRLYPHIHSTTGFFIAKLRYQ
ncbi:MAG: RsmB/NOP family class I SAM-dependent RNA methyltransferase, partial [Thermoproteales archaeon]|nr:RsmB/NOP family class I SAM-dependent RNA methyltransferase [Thermoproteales archaeon]